MSVVIQLHAELVYGHPLNERLENESVAIKLFLAI